LRAPRRTAAALRDELADDGALDLTLEGYGHEWFRVHLPGRLRRP